MIKYRLKECRLNKDFQSRSIQGTVFLKEKWSYADKLNSVILKNFSSLIEIQEASYDEYKKILEEKRHACKPFPVDKKKAIPIPAKKKPANKPTIKKEVAPMFTKEEVIVKEPIIEKEQSVDIELVEKKVEDTSIIDLSSIK